MTGARSQLHGSAHATGAGPLADTAAQDARAAREPRASRGPGLARVLVVSWVPRPGPAPRPGRSRTTGHDRAHLRGHVPPPGWRTPGSDPAHARCPRPPLARSRQIVNGESGAHVWAPHGSEERGMAMMETITTPGSAKMIIFLARVPAVHAHRGSGRLEGHEAAAPPRRGFPRSRPLIAPTAPPLGRPPRARRVPVRPPGKLAVMHSVVDVQDRCPLEPLPEQGEHSTGHSAHEASSGRLTAR